ncbi:MAG TPA: nuclear transport factor 2 family protein [Jiangellales bacterium]|nr:nuclear transport factor 2 family protein [Jiangellales bacterium]
MNAPDIRPLGIPQIDAGQALRCVDAYIDAWNQPEADRRRQILAQVMTDESTYVDPNTAVDSRTALLDYIDGVLNRSPGRQIVRTSEVDVHHLVARFNWRLLRSDGTQGAESVDFVEFTRDGRIRRVVGFFGPLAVAEAP